VEHLFPSSDPAYGEDHLVFNKTTSNANGAACSRGCRHSGVGSTMVPSVASTTHRPTVSWSSGPVIDNFFTQQRCASAPSRAGDAPVLTLAPGSEHYTPGFQRTGKPGRVFCRNGSRS